MKTRKILSAFLGLSMALSSLAIPTYAAAADEIVIGTVSGEAVAYGETLNVKVNGAVSEDEFNWYRVDGENEDDVGYGATYIVTEADMGYSIKAMSDNDDESESVAIADMYKYTFSTNATYKTDAAKGWSVEKDSKANALFKLKNSDKTFVLAKTFNNDESKYFVVANDSYGKKTKVTNGTDSLTPKYDPTYEKDTNLFWTINTKLAKGGWTDNNGTNFALPSEFDKYINYDHIWKTEGTSGWKQYKLDETGNQVYEADEETPVKEDRENMTSYTFTAGVTIPSMTELVTYENIGYSIDCTADANRWHTRTPVDHDNVDAYKWGLAVYMYLEGTADPNPETRKGARTNHGEKTEYAVRPEFYLKDGFFANVAVDLATAGADVIAEIKKQDETALRALYSGADLQTYLGILDETATIEIATLSGETAAYGETLQAKVNGEVASVNWTRIENETETVVGTGETYIVTEADMGCQLKAVVGNAHSVSVSIATIYNKTYSTQSNLKSNADSAPASLFKLKGSDKQFVLVKTFNNDESKYFVVANDGYGKKQLNTSKEITTIDGKTTVTSSVVNDPTIKSEGNFAYWITNSFKNYGNGDDNKLPAEIIKYINDDHIWRTEGTVNWTEVDNLSSYTFKAGITIPSATELEKYDNLGYSIDVGTETRIHLRTPVDHKDSTTKWSLEIYAKGKHDSSTDTQGRLNHTENGSNIIRPEFYLKNGFFANVAVDLATAGADVIAEIKKQSVADLVTLYSDTEMDTYLGIDVSLYPSIVTVSGEDIAYGETVTATVPTGINTADLVWKVDGKTITVTGNKHIITEGEAGKKITAEYTKDGKTYTGGTSVPALLNDPVLPSNAVGGSAISSIKDSPNTFSVGGQEFAIIADFNNSESTFFVAANDTYGTLNFRPEDQTMDYTTTDSLIKKLNDETTGFISGFVEGDTLPDDVVKYIPEHEWLIEAAPNGGVALPEKTFKAKVSLPSISEFKRYNTTFGWAIDPVITDEKESCTRYWSRTPANWNNSKDATPYQLTVGTPMDNFKNFKVDHWDLNPAGTSTNFRPVFYLTEDFFRNVAVDDLNDLFENEGIVEMLTKRYTLEEMDALYSDDLEDGQLESLGFVSDGVKVTFTDANGTALTKLEGATSLKATISAASMKKTFKATAVMALYDGNGNLISVGHCDLDTTNTGSDSDYITFTDLSGVDANYTAKVMFWDSLSGMKPVEKSVTFGTPVNSATNLAFAEGKGNAKSAGGYNFF